MTKRCFRKTYSFIITFVTFEYTIFEIYKVVYENISVVEINLLTDSKFITMIFFIENLDLL